KQYLNAVQHVLLTNPGLANDKIVEGIVAAGWTHDLAVNAFGKRSNGTAKRHPTVEQASGVNHVLNHMPKQTTVVGQPVNANSIIRWELCVRPFLDARLCRRFF